MVALNHLLYFLFDGTFFDNKIPGEKLIEKNKKNTTIAIFAYSRDDMGGCC